MRPPRFRPGEAVHYALVKLPKHGMGPRGPADCSPIRLAATVVVQAHGPANHNVLVRFANGALATTTWPHRRRIK